MKIGIIMGGVSAEREVSLMTGAQMLQHLDKQKYEAVEIVIDKRSDLIEQVKAAEIELALLALHGTYGEDGTVQGALETLGIPYTGSGVLSSSLCMNKELSKLLLQSAGVATPSWLCWQDKNDYDEQAVQQLGYPVIVKPNTGGSSIGTRLVKGKDELWEAAQEAFQWDTSILIEQYIQGEEVTCCILDGELLPIIGIRSVYSEWFDYKAKYEVGGAKEYVVQLPPEIEERVRAAAQTCYRLLKCSVYARVDLIISDVGIPYVLEVNTLPGMTASSLLPKSAEAAGITFDALLDQIISLSMKERMLTWGGLEHVE